MSEGGGNSMEEMLGKVMGNPELLEKISGIASSGGGDLYAKLPEVMALLQNGGIGGEGVEGGSEESRAKEVTASADVKTREASANRKKLLLALRPYLSQPRQNAVDQLLKVTELSSLLGQMPSGASMLPREKEGRDV